MCVEPKLCENISLKSTNKIVLIKYLDAYSTLLCGFCFHNKLMLNSLFCAIVFHPVSVITFVCARLC